jgi:molecular chaperone GrpE
MPKKKIDFEELANQLAAELAEANDALLRERADAANVRRRADEDRVKLGSFYKANVVKDLLTFIDNLDRAIAHAPKGQAPDVKYELWDKWLEGLLGVRKQLEQALEKIGVQRIKTVGEHFDPSIHEAITMEDGDGAEEIVSEELQAGYRVGDEVIRHAMVRVKPQ